MAMVETIASNDPGIARLQPGTEIRNHIIKPTFPFGHAPPTEGGHLFRAILAQGCSWETAPREIALGLRNRRPTSKI
jgi:hypothetical protein